MAKEFGFPLPDWTPPPAPTGETLTGAYVQLEHMDPDAHAADLFRAYSSAEQVWDYLPYGPFSSAAAYHRWAKDNATGNDPLFYVLRNRATGHCGGVASYLRITPASVAAHQDDRAGSPPRFAAWRRPSASSTRYADWGRLSAQDNASSVAATCPFTSGR